jgi:transcriptional regulator with XRE-family HTH domain
VAKEWSKKVFAQNLQRYIAEAGKTQKDIADVIGVSAPTLNEWVTGKKFPRIDKIQRLADYFGILKSDLIEEKMTPEKEKDNDILADIIVRMSMEKDFREAVESLYLLDASRIKGVKQLLQAFTQQPENKV